ncbi:unnamed protein product [Lathyrus sativus]|nr:unnamed protein product [Lathyrus sativus]
MINVGTTYATSENTVSTLPPTISSEMPPPHIKKRKNRSEVWNHFIVSSEEEQNASCKYCDIKIKYNNGTSSMHAHLSRCLFYKRKRTLSSMTSAEEHVGSPLIVNLTVDNASSNDVGVERLKRRLLSKNSLVMSGNHFHMRCCAHILNLIVKEGLKDIDNSVYRVRHAVWYARSSPARLAKFKACIDEESMDYKGLVSLDVETR